MKVLIIMASILLVNMVAAADEASFYPSGKGVFKYNQFQLEGIPLTENMTAVDLSVTPVDIAYVRGLLVVPNGTFPDIDEAIILFPELTNVMVFNSPEGSGFWPPDDLKDEPILVRCGSTDFYLYSREVVHCCTA